MLSSFFLSLDELKTFVLINFLSMLPSRAIDCGPKFSKIKEIALPLAAR